MSAQLASLQGIPESPAHGASSSTHGRVLGMVETVIGRSVEALAAVRDSAAQLAGVIERGVEYLKLEIVEEEKDDVTDLAKASGESPVIRLVNFLIFDAIKQGIAMGLPEKESWRMAFGLLVTLIWLYLEFLRLLAIFTRN